MTGIKNDNLILSEGSEVQQAAIKDASGEGANVVLNGGFESWEFSAWNSWDVATVNDAEVVDDEPRTGDYSVALVSGTLATDEARISQTVTSLTAADTYACSVWAFKDSAATLTVVFYNDDHASATQIWDHTAGSWVSYTYPNAPTSDQKEEFAVTTSWAQYSVTQSPTVPASTKLNVMFMNTGNAAEELYIDDASLTHSITLNDVLTDGSFEDIDTSASDLDEWDVTVNGTATAVLDATNKNSGNYGLAMTTDGSDNSVELEQQIDVGVGTDYKIHYYAARSGADDTRVLSSFFNAARASATQVWNFTTDSWDAYTYPNATTVDQKWIPALSTGALAKYSVTDNVTGPASAVISVWIEQYPQNSSTLYLDDVTFQEQTTTGNIDMFDFTNASDDTDLTSSDTILKFRTTGGGTKTFLEQKGDGKLYINASSTGVDNILDEDNMASDSATALVTQQSVKKYVDDQVATVDTWDEVMHNGESFTSANTENLSCTINQNDVTNNPAALVITNTGSGNDITSPNFTLINGAVTGTSLSDGTASISSGAVSSVTTISQAGNYTNTLPAGSKLLISASANTNTAGMIDVDASSATAYYTGLDWSHSRTADVDGQAIISSSITNTVAGTTGNDFNWLDLTVQGNAGDNDQEYNVINIEFDANGGAGEAYAINVNGTDWAECFYAESGDMVFYEYAIDMYNLRDDTEGNGYDFTIHASDGYDEGAVARNGGVLNLYGGAKANAGNDGYVKVGQGAGSPGTITATDDDLYVLGQIEADGLIQADGGVRVLATKMIQGSQGTDIASANDAAVPTSNYCDVTGTTQINTMAATNLQAGTMVVLQFDASVTVKHATAGAGAQFQLAASGDFSATAGDTLMVVYDGTYWREVSRTAI